MQAGKDLERGLLGSPNPFDEELEIPENFRPKDVVPLVRKHEARLMSLTRENQSGNPRAPKKPFLRRLASDIDNLLVDEIALPEKYEVRIYSAVGTSLDAAGIDF
ncbi:MAG: hypothetical protein IH962_06095, partial [Chloroflexi bacterium]|nr:hypothetical protein [Chloroflexota bacterium]